MEIFDIWIEKEEYERRLDYLLFAFNNIETEVYKSFEIAPLRKSTLDISSMFYADISLRMYSLLTIGFNLITFGFGMQSTYNFIRQMKEEEKDKKIVEGIDIIKIEKELIELKKKNIKNRDTLRDYYLLYLEGEIKKSNYFSFQQEYLTTSFNVGRIEYDEEIHPFNEDQWHNYTDNRNSIEHRGNISSTMLNAINALAALYLLLRKLCFTGPLYRQLKSNIFGGYVVGRVPKYQSFFDLFRDQIF